MNIEEIVLDSLQDLVQKIQTNIDRSGKNAGGTARSSLQIEHNGDEYRITAVPYFSILETGRGPGKVPYRFQDVIKEWAQRKGLNFSTERELNSFAYLTARKIAREGTRQFKDGRRTDIYTDVTEEFVGSLAEKIVAFYDLDVLSKL